MGEREETSQTYTDEETGGKGNVRISNGAIDKFMSQSAVDKSDSKDVHMAVLKVLPEVLKASIDVETHPDFLKGKDGKRSAENAINKDVLVHRCYGAVDIDGRIYRVKITLKEDVRNKKLPHNTHSYEATKIELLEGTLVNPEGDNPNTNNSISAAKLLENVGMSYNPAEKVLDASKKRDDIARLQKVYYGSHADFDHSHMGEGAQAYGWGTYVTEVEGIDKAYTHTKDGPTRRCIQAQQDFIKQRKKDIKANEDYEKYSRKIMKNCRASEREYNAAKKIGDENDMRFYQDLMNTADEQLKPENHKKLKEEGPHGSMVYEKDGEEIDIFAKRYFVHQYNELSRGLESDKAASQLLAKVGFVGIKSLADYIRGGREDGKKNYVIFDEKDAKITNHVRFFRTSEGEAYGFTVGGKIYIDPRIADTETPIHEYAHLWAFALRRGNAKEWSNVVELMKGTSIWNKVKERYPELKTDSDIADEVIAHYSGSRGAERLRKEYGGEEAKGVMTRVKEALDRFWKATADMLHIHYTTAEEVADRVMKDLLDGVDPRKFKNEPEDSDSYDEGGVRFRMELGKTFSDTKENFDGVRDRVVEEKGIVMPNLKKESVKVVSVEKHKFKGENGTRSVENGYGNNTLVHRLYGAVELGGKTYRVKTTMQEFRGGEKNKPHSYEVTKIELLDTPGTAVLPDSSPLDITPNNSISAAKLLNGVEKSYDKGKKLLDESKDLPEGETRFRKDDGVETPTHEEDLTPREREQKEDAEVHRGNVLEATGKLNPNVAIHDSVDDVENPAVRRAIENGEKVKAWYDVKTGEVHVYLPNVTDKYDVQNQVEQARFTGTMQDKNGTDVPADDTVMVFADKDENEYVLVGGDVVIDTADGSYGVGKSGIVVFRDKDGNLVQRTSFEGLNEMGKIAMDEYADYIRTTLQEKKTAEIQSSEMPMPEGKTEAGGTNGVETPSHEEGTPTEKRNSTVQDNPEFYKVAESLQGKVGQSLSKDEADSLVSEMEERAEPARELELTPENWTAEFGEGGKVKTPLGEVKMGENQLAKLFMKGREAELGMIKPTLTNPDVIIEESSNAADGKEERSSSYLFVKTFMRDGKKVKFYTSVTVKKDGMEVVVSNHFMNKNAVDRKMQEGKMIYIKGLSTSNSSDRHLAEHPNGVPDLLPTQENDNPSDGKDTTKSSDLQENNGTLTFKDGTEVPMNEKGEPDFGKMTPEQGAELYESNFGKDAESVLADEKKDAEKALKDANKMKIKGDGWNGRLKAKEEKDAAITAAQAEIDRVDAIQKALTAKKVAETIDNAKPEGPTTDEANTAGSVAAEKFQKAPKLTGRKGTRTLADGTKIKGTYMIVPAESLTASHDATDDYKKSEGFPVNAEGRTVNDRDYEHDRDAQDVTEKMSANYDGQAVNQVPTVSDEGIVYDGNGRTMAGQLAAKKGTDKEYIESLKENAEGFGFTAEDVDKIEHPRVIFVPDERLPYDTETFARFNRNEKKSQSNTQEAIVNSKKLSGEDVGAIVSEMESSGSLDSFFNNPKAINSLLKTLVEKGIIGQNEVAGLKDGDLMSAKGREFVQNLLLGSVFKEDTLKMLGIEKGLKSKALNAMRQILDNAKLGEYSLRDEVDKAIQLLYEAKRQGYTVDGLLRQPEMFGESASERYPIEVQIMAKALEGKVADFKELMDVYNRNAQVFNTGEVDMFGEKPTKEEFINEILKLENWKKYDTRKEKQAEQSTADVRGAEGGEQKTRGNNEKGKGGEEGGVKLEDPSDAEEGLIKNAGAFNGGKANGEESPSHEDGEEMERKQKSENAEAPSEREKKLRDAVIDRMKENGMDVIADTEEGQRVLEMANGGGVRMSAKKRRALETASLGTSPRSLTVVSSADGAKGTATIAEDSTNKATGVSNASAKVQTNLDNLAKSYEKKSTNKTRGFITDLSRALKLKQYEASNYGSFVLPDGRLLTIRISNHNARVSNFDRNSEDNGISIVISSHKNKGLNNDGIAHIIEYFYHRRDIEDATGKPLAEIVRSIEQCLYSGEFKDATGLAERQEVNADDVARFQKVYHGSQADFDHFDHSHMGEGEGAQVYGWGTYVTEVKGIGKAYAHTKDGPTRRSIQAQQDFIKQRKKDIKANEDYEKYSRRIMKNRRASEREYNAAKKIGDEKDMRFYQDLMDTADEQLKPENHKKLIESFHDDINKAQAKIDELEKSMEGTHHLYTVDIPKDNGENYLDWNNPTTDKQIDGIRKYLFENYRKQKLEAFDASISETKNAPNADEVNAWVRKGENIYKTLKELLGSDKEASKALSEIGFAGIKYPADNMRGGREDGKKNYVIFDEKDAKITNHVRFFRTSEGEAYGFTVGGKIYIDPRIADTETPIHEYAHLWASALRRGNAKEWSNVVELMKGTSIWNKVKERYPELKTDSDIADEVIAHYSGSRGAERLRKEYGGEEAKGVMARVKEALDRFWKATADMLHIHYTTAEEVADRVMKDLLDGVDPRKFKNEPEDSDSYDEGGVRFRKGEGTGKYAKESRIVPQDVDKEVSSQIEKKFDDEVEKAFPNEQERRSAESVIYDFVERYSYIKTSEIIDNVKEWKENDSWERRNGGESSSRGHYTAVRFKAAMLASEREMEYRRVRANRIKGLFGIEGRGRQIPVEGIAKAFEETKGRDSRGRQILFRASLDLAKRLGTKFYLEESGGKASYMGVTHTDREIGFFLDGLTRTATNAEEFNVTIAHELLHQSVNGAINLVKKGKAKGFLSDRQIEGVNTILDIYNKVKNDKERFKENTYGLKNEYEFAAQMADPRQRKALDTDIFDRVVNAARELVKKGDYSLWQRVKDAFGKLFETSDKKKMDKALDNIMEDFNEAVHDYSMEDIEQEGFGYKVEDPKEIERLEKGPKVKVYRAMQVIDGKLYPPMAAKVNGGLVEARELGEWERADENPDLAIPDIDTKTGKQKVDKKTGELKWKFKLDKGGKDAKGKKLGDINAAYNPYWHTSRSPLNDQFSSAYKRPNLKVVEVEVPESELTSGYKAERAKDAVGEMTWHSGPVSSKLPKEKERKVILSRWDKPVRVLSDAEAADRIAEMLRGEDIEIPDNTVTPGMKAELVKRGLKVKETDEVKKWNESLRFRKDDGVETPTHEEDLTPREREQKEEMAVHRKNVAEATEKLNANVAMHESVDDVENEAVRRAIENGEKVKAWFDVRIGEVHVYLPNVTSQQLAIKFGDRFKIM